LFTKTALAFLTCSAQPALRAAAVLFPPPA